MALRIEGVTKTYPSRGGVVTALETVDLNIVARESFGLVGESGSGKTTLTRCILGLEPVTSGRILYEGVDLASLSAAEMRRMRARIQIVFQDPYASLNPRMSAHDIIEEPMVIHRDSLGLNARQRTRPRGRAAAARRPRRTASVALPARVLRRPAPAHRHRPRARRGPRGPDPRRADLRARRVGAGAGAQPAARSAAAASR